MLLYPSLHTSDPPRGRGQRTRGQQDIAFLAKQSRQSWGSPEGRGHFSTTCSTTWGPFHSHEQRYMSQAPQMHMKTSVRSLGVSLGTLL